MARALPLHTDSPKAPASDRRGLAAKGFRPFFLLAAAFALGVVPLWLFTFMGKVRAGTYLDPMTWHAHEMIFGFAMAVVIGFLLTAVGNWTQRETLVGAPLLGLAALWVLGRAGMFFAHALPFGTAALIDLAFLPIAIVALARPLLAARSSRNFALVAVLGALLGANALVHLDALGVLAPGTARRACSASIDLVLVIIMIIAGRVLPMFTRNATNVSSIRSIPSLDVGSVVAMAALALIDFFWPRTPLGAGAAALTAVLAAARAWHWGARHSLRQPLLWILHAGYAWLVIGLALRALHGFDTAVPSSLATHALTVGAIGSLTVGMMARVALGHTGRMLVASPAVPWAFVAINAAAIARAIVPLAAPAAYRESLIAAGVLWSLAFAIFLLVYAPVLVAPRADGKPG